MSKYIERKPGLIDLRITKDKHAAVDATYRNGNPHAKGLIMAAMYGASLGSKGRIDSALRARFKPPVLSQGASHFIDCREAFH